MKSSHCFVINVFHKFLKLCCDVSLFWLLIPWCQNLILLYFNTDWMPYIGCSLIASSVLFLQRRWQTYTNLNSYGLYLEIVLLWQWKNFSYCSIFAEVTINIKGAQFKLNTMHYITLRSILCLAYNKLEQLDIANIMKRINEIKALKREEFNRTVIVSVWMASCLCAYTVPPLTSLVFDFHLLFTLSYLAVGMLFVV